MSTHSSKKLVLSIGAAVAVSLVQSLQAVEFPFMDPNYNQQIYVAPLVGGPAAAWTSAGNMLTRNGSAIYEYDLSASLTINSTNVHPIISTHNVPGLSGSGYAMTNSPNGLIYVNTGTSIQSVNPANWSQPAVNLGAAGGYSGGGYSINALANGKIVYSDTAFTSKVYIYDPGSNTHSQIYTMPTGVNVDDIETGPGNIIAVAGQTGPQITIMDQFGNTINSFNTPATSYPDGLAFGGGTFANSMYSNNNDGSITRFDFPNPGFTGVPSVVYIAKGAGTNNVNGPGAYGDLAAVGPDCAFYVYNGPNGGANFSAIAGTRWDDGTLTLDGSITRISLTDPASGEEICGFYHNEVLPEPTSLGLLGLGSLALLRRKQK